MKTLYLECSMGAAGDMLMGALLELIENKTDFLKQINSLGFSNFRVNIKCVKKCGIVGTRILISINDKQPDIISQNTHINTQQHKENCHNQNKNDHINIKKIENVIRQLKISQKVKSNSLAIYQLIAEAEARVHKCPVKYIHFHEIGNIDALIDIIGVCILIEYLGPEEITVSPINVGSGFINCQHGILPVPAPATAYILQDIPIYNDNNVRDELCTPTGAAIIKYFATNFKQMPKMRVKKIGYGMGAKDFEQANCVRAFLGEIETKTKETNDIIVKLECNLDDMTGEAIGFTVDLLFEKGALDVFITPIQAKKSRPAVLLTCICNEYKSNFFIKLMLRHTTTFGVRKNICDRYVLKRKTSIQKTPYGNIRVKTGEGYSVKKVKPEYEDIVKVARLNNVSFNDVNNATVDLTKKKYEQNKTKI
ncbi:MAG: nickel pincer cofactor biosynthesis protein LarC [Endomicrobium sp.]|nr:nickel pincer cofactor biosynthesis protein LarC [Endomicrobium sp.]